MAELAGRSLGERTVSYDERDAILYALAVGARETDLDLIFEDRLRVLPTFGLTLAQWAPDILSEEGYFDKLSVHGSQTLDVLGELPRAGSLTLAARVGNVWDKGSAAVVEVVVECEFFKATWSIFCPGRGGFGGERGPSASASASASAASGDPAQDQELADILFSTFPTQAALYRLTGDRHHIHIDPEASARIGQPKPILQGLCTLAAALLPLAEARGAHPAGLRSMTGRFSGPVVPGDELTIRRQGPERFEVLRGDAAVITGGSAVFA
ncbi:MaoC/PaaZ C-terminal domain-containing protein [Leucobacter luti]|uniref:MaoC/PaaZ C-terminal domain-containing protein n=1 Tax=Leucobacter luti TaxID=340320 RepID=UPI003D03BD24